MLRRQDWLGSEAGVDEHHPRISGSRDPGCPRLDAAPPRPHSGEMPMSSEPYHVMLKPRGAICDLDCSYCYYLAKAELFPGSGFRMSDEVLESFTRQYLQTQLSAEVTFGWQGGEPTLMGLDFYRKAVELQRTYAPPGVRVVNTLQTNGVRLDEAWCSFFRDHGFLIGISIDGPAAVHDAYRVDKGGKPTHEPTLAGWSS
jgi:uncharacterized protein